MVDGETDAVEFGDADEHKDPAGPQNFNGLVDCVLLTCALAGDIDANGSR